MNKKFFIAWAVIFVLWMVGGMVVHGVLLGAEYAKLTSLYRSPEESQKYFPLMILAHVILAGAFVWIYSRGAEANKPWLGQGLRFALGVALLTIVPTYTIYYVVQPMPGMLAVKQLVFDGIWMLILGVAVAFLYKGQGRA